MRDAAAVTARLQQQYLQQQYLQQAVMLQDATGAVMADWTCDRTWNSHCTSM